MALTSDNYIERSQLKRQVSFWRLAAILVIIGFVILLVERNKDFSAISPVSGDYIARLYITDTIVENSEFYEMLDKVAANDSIKAVILHMNTPGGEAVAGETIFRKIKAIAAKKPVVATMRSVCASAGYMIALAADQIFAMNGTITGSIGSLFQTVEVSELADKLGVHPITVTSGELKAVPSLYEPLPEKGRDVLQSMIDDFQQYFVRMVADNRKLDVEEVSILADGRIYSGPQAVENGLVDAIGGEDEALEWLKSTHDIDTSLAIRDVKLKSKMDEFYESLSQSAAQLTGLQSLKDRLDASQGLMLLWRPTL